jgi:hypothetical protein
MNTVKILNFKFEKCNNEDANVIIEINMQADRRRSVSFTSCSIVHSLSRPAVHLVSIHDIVIHADDVLKKIKALLLPASKTYVAASLVQQQ